MKRVVVIGSPGAGKSTLSARLATATGLPLYHLDALYWKPGWVETSREAWREQLQELAGTERWIMDGHYGATLEQRLQAADTLVWLDMPRRLCLWGVIKRKLVYWRRTRPDLGEGCTERFNLEFLTFLQYIWRFPAERRPRIKSILERYAPGRRLVVLRSRSQAVQFLQTSALVRDAKDER